MDFLRLAKFLYNRSSMSLGIIPLPVSKVLKHQWIPTMLHDPMAWQFLVLLYQDQEGSNPADLKEKKN